MIFDDLRNAESYYGLGSRFRRAFDYLKSADVCSIAGGRYEIDAADVIAIVQSYQTKPREQRKWEAHRKYADIQCIISGRERMGIAPLEAMSVTDEYDPERDLSFFSGEGQFLEVKAGQFMIFLPQDVHMPSLAVDESREVTKVVMKVRL